MPTAAGRCLLLNLLLGLLLLLLPLLDWLARPCRRLLAFAAILLCRGGACHWQKLYP